MIISLDIIGFSRSYADDVRRRVGEAVGIPAENVHLCATHTHSTPTFLYLRQWGKLPDDYAEATKEKVVEAARKAKDDLSPAELHLGKASAKGANFNRTTEHWKTDAEFNAESTDEQRWLDTTLHTMRFVRGSGKHDLLWYHFSAHPVCYGDGLAGPDWVGGVLERIRESEKLSPAFLQGHAGDVNPGDGTPWIGDPNETIGGVVDAMGRAIANARTIRVNDVKLEATEFQLPLDIDRLKEDLAAYERDPEKCNSGPWVDAPFAKAWYEEAKTWKLDQAVHATPLSTLRLGPVALLFHSTELYSFYGLAIRRDSPLEDTIVVGYADDLVGYVTDPAAYANGEYAAVVVPRIVNLPPFTPQAGRELARSSVELLKKVSG